MGIWNIDGYNKDSKGRSREEEFHIKLLIHNKKWNGVYLDVEITPIFCVYCNRQVEELFKLDGSRYGQVGDAGCNYCGSVLYCTDHDNMVDEIKISSTNNKTKILNYHTLYGLENEVWISLKDKIGYDIFTRYENEEWTTLQSVINDICSVMNIKLEDIPSRQIITDKDIPVLPTVVTEWLNLKEYFNIN